MKPILSLCDYTGNMVLPWANAGYECWVVDITQPIANHPNIRTIQADVLHLLPPKLDWGMVFAAPPCTDLAISGCRWFKHKGLGVLASALQVVDACKSICEWAECPWMLENPISTLATNWRKPDFYFHPYEFTGYTGGENDTYSKKTSLWTGNGFKYPQPKESCSLVSPDMAFIRDINASGEERQRLRSATPMGFAQAVFEANQP